LQHASACSICRVDLAGVEGEQQIALVDLGTVLEVNRYDGGFDAGLERHARNRRHRPIESTSTGTGLRSPSHLDRDQRGFAGPCALRRCPS